MKNVLTVGESLTIIGDGVRGSLILTNTGAAINVDGFDNGLMRRYTTYPRNAQEATELGPLFSAPFSTGRANQEEPAIQNMPGTLSAALEMHEARHGWSTSARASVDPVNPSHASEIFSAEPPRAPGVPKYNESELGLNLGPDFKSVANELYDMLSRTLAALETPGDLTPEEAEHNKRDAAELLDRVYAEVKDK